ncbi:hypothetical protein [Desulfosporosinus sp.]|uniref:hypothetical protein n=1 Tax=Desulfosporosinus sp. TaxID=157907 RepID=UPI0026113AD4|nr:hypothetical protein [Desulfosporosinus sp.]
MKNKRDDERAPLKFRKWVRCGEYKIEQIKFNGWVSGPYICPVPDSGFIRYDIEGTQIDRGSRKVEENTLVLSLLNLDTSSEKAIINFVNQFGLLGLLSYKYLEPMFLPAGFDSDSEKLLIPERRGMSMARVEDVANQYLIPLERMTSRYDDLIHLISEDQVEFTKAVKDFQEVGKWVSAINKCAKSGKSGPLRSLMMSAKYKKYYKEAAETASDPELIEKASMKVSFLLESSGITREIGPGDQEPWVAIWSFDSLLSAAYFFLSEYMLSNFWIGECPRCGKHFLSSVKTQNYCSRKCDDATRKAISRKALKEKAKMDK